MVTWQIILKVCQGNAIKAYICQTAPVILTSGMQNALDLIFSKHYTISINNSKVIINNYCVITLQNAFVQDITN